MTTAAHSQGGRASNGDAAKDWFFHSVRVVVLIDQKTSLLPPLIHCFDSSVCRSFDSRRDYRSRAQDAC